jgi:rubredoxin
MSRGGKPSRRRNKQGDTPFSTARHCPRCGVSSVLRDNYGKGDGTQYFCSTCGFGYRLLPSLRWQTAQQIFNEHRKLRPHED